MHSTKIIKADVIKVKVQRIILGVGIFIFLIKMTAFYFTNSVSILSDALESTVNVITALITLKSLQFASIPRDKNHPYGHGKVELLTASIEGILIGIAGILIIREAIIRLYTPAILESIDIGIILMALTAIINYLAGRYSINTGKKYGSVGLVTGAQHLYTDSLSTIALIGGLLLYHFTGITALDSILAIIFGLIILYTGFRVLKNTVTKLMDEANPDAIQKIINIILAYKQVYWIDIHKLTYLEFGNIAHIDMHLTLPWYYNIKEAEQHTSTLKRIIREDFKYIDVDISIQCEPCTSAMCHQCKVVCAYREHEFTTDRVWNFEQITGNNIYNNIKI